MLVLMLATNRTPHGLIFSILISMVLFLFALFLSPLLLYLLIIYPHIFLLLSLQQWIWLISSFFIPIHFMTLG